VVALVLNWSRLGWARLEQTGPVWAGLCWDGLVWDGLVQAGLMWATVGSMLGWIEVAEGRGGEEATMSWLDCVRIETSLSIPHKHDHWLLVFSEVCNALNIGA